MKKALAITAISFAAAVILMSIGWIVRTLWLPVHSYQQGVDMAYGVVDKTLDSEEAIRNYEWFITQRNDIKRLYDDELIAQAAHESFVAQLPTLRSEWSDFDKREEASLRNSLTAIEKVLNKAINDYNNLARNPTP